MLQSLILRLLTETVLRGQRDDHWWVLGLLIVSITGLCWAWHRWVGQGPFDRILRAPVAMVRRVSGGSRSAPAPR